MEISIATPNMLPEILAVYETARIFMNNNGNPTQWAGNYPQENLLIDDINNKNLYVIKEADVIEGVFYFSKGPDKTYEYIKGEWANPLPYYVIHRIASAGRKRGILKTAVDYCLSISNNIKIDTHKDNLVMQSALEKLGFIRCGIIYLENGEERIAYQVVK